MNAFQCFEKSDAILFTRDDIDKHWEMAGELFKCGKPIFIDKVLAHTPEDLRKSYEQDVQKLTDEYCKKRGSFF